MTITYMDFELKGKKITVPVYNKDSETLGEQMIFRFPNGYGASIIRGEFTYGGPQGLYELAVIKFSDNSFEKFNIVYHTPITDDVIGYLTQEEVLEYCQKILELEGE